MDDPEQTQPNDDQIGDVAIEQDVDAALARILRNLVSYEVRDGVVYLTGVVGNEMQKEQIERMVRDVPGVRDVRNEIGIAESSQVDVGIIPDVPALQDADTGYQDGPWKADLSQDEPDFSTSGTGRALSEHTTDLPSLTDVTQEHRSEDTEAEDVSPKVIARYDTDIDSAPHQDSTTMELDGDFTDDIGTTDPQVATQEAIPYYPPTDPVIISNPNAEHGFEEVGGIAALADTPTQMLGNDEDVEERIRFALRTNGLTTDLRIRVRVNDGVATIRGRVPSIDIAEEVEAIVADVEGVIEVNEELEIEM